MFNLDFLRDIFPYFCLHPKLNILAVISLDYIIAIYPFLLILLAYILIKMYDRNYKLIVLAWKPFKWCLKHRNSQWDVSASLTQTFASLILLSSIKTSTFEDNRKVRNVHMYTYMCVHVHACMYMTTDCICTVSWRNVREDQERNRSSTNWPGQGEGTERTGRGVVCVRCDESGVTRPDVSEVWWADVSGVMGVRCEVWWECVHCCRAIWDMSLLWALCWTGSLQPHPQLLRAGPSNSHQVSL